MDKNTGKKYEPLEMSIKHGHIHCYLSAPDMNAFIDRMDDLETAVRQHMEEKNLTCIAVRLDTDGFDVKNDTFYGNAASKLLGIYDIIEAENMSRPEKDTAGKIQLLVECEDALMRKITKQKPNAEYFRRLRKRGYLKHVRSCGTSYRRANQIEKKYEQDKYRMQKYAKQTIKKEAQ